MANTKISTKDKLLDAAYIEIYKYGYQGCSVDRILKNANVPKGSMYHSYKSKKELALGVINERIAPKMLNFFVFENVKPKKEIDVLEEKLKQLADIDYLLTYGCPLNKLVREMYSLDIDFQTALQMIYNKILSNLNKLLEQALLNGTIKNCNTKELTNFIYTAVIGNLSLGEGNNSKDGFLSSLSHLFTYIESFKN